MHRGDGGNPEDGVTEPVVPLAGAEPTTSSTQLITLEVESKIHSREWRERWALPTA